eukprot:c21706_g1_i1 orf=441-893(-)
MMIRGELYILFIAGCSLSLSVCARQPVTAMVVPVVAAHPILFCCPPPSLCRWSSGFKAGRHRFAIISSHRRHSSGSLQIKAVLNPEDEPILKEALKEPIAFFGGLFAGLFRLNLNEDPLREWVTRTVKTARDVEEDSEVLEESLQEIQIE